MFAEGLLRNCSSRDRASQPLEPFFFVKMPKASKSMLSADETRAMQARKKA